MGVLKKTAIGLAGTALASLAITLWWQSISPSMIEIPIRLSPNHFPLVDMDIGGEKYPVCLALSAKYPLSLNKEILASLRKSPAEEGSSTNILGEKSHFPTYWLPQLALEKMKRTHVRTTPSSNKNVDGLGVYAWPIEEMSILLDFPHRKIIGIKNNKVLKTLGYSLEKMVRIDCHIKKSKVSFNFNTSAGELTGAVITASNYNLIRESSCEGKGLLSLGMELGGTYFEETQFMPYPITPELECDVILGTPFLQDHIVYLDAKGGHLYIGNRFASSITHDPPTRIPLEMDPGGSPILEIEVNKKKHRVMFDTGYCGELTLKPGSISTEGLTYLYSNTSYNFFGEEQQAPHYLLPSCHIGPAKATNLILSTQKKVGVATKYQGTQAYGITKESGYLGLPFLNRTNVYLDFSQAALWLVEKPEHLKKIKVDLDHYHKVPFELALSGMVLTFGSDLGDLRLTLDTGSGLTFVKPEKLAGCKEAKDADSNLHVSSQSFTLNGHEYGEQNLYLLNISPKFGPIDGVLGVDFLRKHPVYIDYPNRVVYFRKE